MGLNGMDFAGWMANKSRISLNKKGASLSALNSFGATTKLKDLSCIRLKLRS